MSEETYIAMERINAGDKVEYRPFQDRTLTKVWRSPMATGYPLWLMWLARVGIWKPPLFAGTAATCAVKKGREVDVQLGVIGRVLAVEDS